MAKIEAEKDDYEDLDDGAGCTEIWEYLSKKRRANEGGQKD